MASLFILGVILGGVGTAMIRSAPGQHLLLEAGLERVNRALAGALVVEGVRSPSLLGGAVLVGVRLDAAGGRRFLEADSVRVRYSLLSFLGAPPKVAAVTVYRPRIEISRYPGEEELNVARLVAPAPPSQEAPARRGQGFALGSVRLVDATLEVLTPVEGEPAGVPLVPAPGGEGSLRRLAFEQFHVLLEEVVLGGGEAALAARLSDLSAELHLLDRPLVLTRVTGSVRYGGGGLELSQAEFRLPGSELEGDLRFGPTAVEGEGWTVRLDVRTRGTAQLADLAWLDERIGSGTLAGGISLSAGETLEVRLVGVDVDLEGSRLALDGGVRVDEGLVFDGLEIRSNPLALGLLEPWLDRDLPLDGWLSGNVRLSGRPAALSAAGRMTLVPTGFGGAPTTADVRGTLHLAGDPGVTNLRLVLDPLNPGLIALARPGLVLRGPAAARVDASGRASSGLRFAAELSHGESDEEGSHVLLHGVAQQGAQRLWAVDVAAELAPLSFALLGEAVPGLASGGSITGTVRAEGALADLRIAADLTQEGGRLEVEANVALGEPDSGYRLRAELDDLDLARAVPALPGPFRWSGRIELEGRGASPESARLEGRITAGASRVGGLSVDTVATAFRVEDGYLRVDTLTGRMGGFQVDGAGDLGLAAEADGELRLAFRTGNLLGIRPLFMGETVLARDTLSVLERQLLLLQGVDVDSLPLLADVAMSGVLDADVLLVGSLPELGLRGGVRLRDGVYGAIEVASADLHLDGRDLTIEGRRLDVALEARNVVALGRSFGAVDGLLGLDGRSGDASLTATQATGERYAVAGTFSTDALGGGWVKLDRAALDVEDVTWRLARPTLVSWDSASLTLSGAELVGMGGDPMAVRADGTLAWNGVSDFRVRGTAVDLGILARVAKMEDPLPGGRLTLSLDVTGPAEDPEIRGSFHVVEPRFGTLALTGASCEVVYARQEAVLDIRGAEGPRQVFRAAGSVPVDLALRPAGPRVLDRPMDVRVQADSLAASLVLSTFTFLEDVDGVVSGDFRVRGTLTAPEPSGVVDLTDGAWSIEALGVRHARVSGTLTLNPDRTLEVAVDGRAAGTAIVGGQIHLDPLSDARLDLTIGFRGFQALSRRDMAGLMSGDVRLVGSYRAPRVEGALTVDQGTLFLEEFVRSAEIVDLTDPRIFQVVDTTALFIRPLLAGIRNPFLQNLRVDVDLSVPRDTWLRSEEMNVEIGGELLVRYDRVSRDVVMVGELQALRGSYTVLGRRFDVQGGTVGFPGTPGVNPTLDLRAMSRIRRVDAEPLDVTASVEGTLTQPRVTLSSEDQGIAESDLVSYLIFGRPSHELATGPETWLGGAAGSFVGAATGAGVSFLSGTLAARLGAALSRQIGLDYLAITQAGDFGVLSGSLAGSLAGTQVEVGQYLGERVFMVLIFRPPTGQNTTQSFFGGARMEVALTDDYNVQAFWEDRFLRGRSGGFGDLGYQAPQVVGIFIFREWGY